MIICPLCRNTLSTENYLLMTSSEIFDNSCMYKDIKILSCDKCGHVFNYLSVDDKIKLYDYYNKEASLINGGNENKIADLPGSLNKNTLKRYDALYKFIKKYLKKDSKILDAGCASGGFLKYLYDKGYRNLYGIDIVNKYIQDAEKLSVATIKLSDVENMSFNDKFDFIILDHVLEHCINPDKVIEELKKILNINGYLYIGVPDASKYHKNYFFYHFWFILKEHIHHFDIHHIKFILSKYNFKFKKKQLKYQHMMADKMILPNLMMVFKYDEKINEYNNKLFKLKNNIFNYIERDNELLKYVKFNLGYYLGYNDIYIWGVGKELFYVFKKIRVLGNRSFITFIDKNKCKQKEFTFKKCRIHPPEILQKANKDDSVLIITAVAHKDEIEKEARKLGYKGNIIKL